MLRNNRGQIFTIIELLVVVVIILGAGYWVATNYLSPSKKAGKTTVATPMGRAVGVDCQNNLQQIRYAINMYQQSDDKQPAALTDLKSYGVTETLNKCPTSGKPYSYDAAQGKVWCATPGHEKY